MSQLASTIALHTKGRKRHMTVDTLGLILRVLVTAASVPEREGVGVVHYESLTKQNGARVLH